MSERTVRITEKVIKARPSPKLSDRKSERMLCLYSLSRWHSSTTGYRICIDVVTDHVRVGDGIASAHTLLQFAPRLAHAT